MRSMSPHGPNMRSSPWATLRSYRRDPSVTGQKLAPGTLKRIFRFAAPYRRQLVALVLMLGADSAIGVVNPLLFREIINRGIVRHDGGLVVALAAVAAGLALF